MERWPCEFLGQLCVDNYGCQTCGRATLLPARRESGTSLAPCSGVLRFNEWVCPDTVIALPCIALPCLSSYSIALAVRLHDLDGESIWTDEAFSIAMARHSVVEIASRTAAGDTTPPLYYLVLHVWNDRFGDSAVSARMPSVIAGVMAVVLVLSFSSDKHHLIEKHLLGSRRRLFERHYADIDVQMFEQVEGATATR